MREWAARPMVVTLRPMTEADLDLLRRWLAEPHVARWWTEPVEREIEGYRRAIAGTEPTHALVAVRDGRPVGWCQWYRWADYPEAAEYGAGPTDVGIDYALGEPAWIGRGVGTALIGALVQEIRTSLPTVPLLVSVDVANHASRRVLAKNGFALVECRNIPSEPEDLSALYRL